MVNISITMQGRLNRCLLLAMSVPAEGLPGSIIPNGFRLQTYKGRAFWNVVVCHVDKMRPLGVPKQLGMSYHHVAYRLYVEADTEQGVLQGLYFTHSQADSRTVCIGGNLASDFRFHFDRIEMMQQDTTVKANSGRIEDAAADAFMLSATMQSAPPRAIGNTFSSQEEALKFLKYRPMGLSLNDSGAVRIARVTRNEANWSEHNLDINELDFSYFFQRELPQCKLELATWVKPIDYRWKLGETVRLA